MDLLRHCRPTDSLKKPPTQTEIPKHTITIKTKVGHAALISLPLFCPFYTFVSLISLPRLQTVGGGSQGPLITSSIAELVTERGSEVVENGRSTRA